MTKKVLNEKGQIVDLPEGSYTAVGHTYPGVAVKPSKYDRLQCGFWGNAPGPCGYYHAYFWNSREQRAYFEIGCEYSASHMQPDAAKAALRVAAASAELAEANRELDALQ